MFKINKKKKEIEEENINKPRFYKRMVTDVSEEELKKYWSDNNCQVPNINFWEDLYKFLKDEKITLTAKLEAINNLECNNEYWEDEKIYPIPDYFWQDTTLDRKVRALCRTKSETYMNVSTQGYDYNKVNIYYERLIKSSDDDLFLGLCELQGEPLDLLFNSDKLSLEQKELIVKCAINFKKSFNRQNDYYRDYTLLTALEYSGFSEELKKEIYEKEKQNVISLGRLMFKGVWPNFLNRFYNDDKLGEEDKIRILKSTLPDEQGNDYSKEYLFYLGNKNIPSYIQRLVLNHFVNATRYNLEHSHPQTYRNLNASNFVNILLNSELPLDLKVRLINGVTNPMLLCYAIMQEEVDDTLAELLKTKLETLKISETKEVLEIIKTLISNPELCGKRLIKKQEK